MTLLRNAILMGRFSRPNLIIQQQKLAMILNAVKLFWGNALATGINTVDWHNQIAFQNSPVLNSIELQLVIFHVEIFRTQT